jgi:selenocysteine lyase/cysteine desulfurase
MFAAHGYKWLLSPTGAGFMYVSPELRRWLEPNVIGWRSHRDWRSHENLHHGAPEFKPDAERYEGGMLGFPLIYAMAASVEMMLEIGRDAIEARVLDLADRTREILRRAGPGRSFSSTKRLITTRLSLRRASKARTPPRWRARSTSNAW